MTKGLKQNFICIGAQKAGTTTLADILSQHPDIYIPPIKETKYFLFDEDYNKGIGFYNSYFETWKGQKAVGEVDPDYLLYPYTAKRIAETLGKDIKIIVVLRNPADRAYSHYLMTKRKGLEPYEFEESIGQEANRKNNLKEQKIFAYIERGYYGSQLKQFMEVFPREQFLILLFEEDLISNKAATIKKVQEFLCVPYHELDLNLHSNEAGEAKSELVRDLVRRPNVFKRILKSVVPSKEFRKSVRKLFINKNMQKAASPKLETGVKARIINKYFLEDIHLTESLINRDLSAWYK